MKHTSPRLQKAEKLAAEIQKTKDKIAALQERVRELEQQKTDLENSEIVAQFRSLDASPAEVAAFLAALRDGSPVPALSPSPAEDSVGESALEESDLSGDVDDETSDAYTSGYASRYRMEDE